MLMRAAHSLCMSYKRELNENKKKINLKNTIHSTDHSRFANRKKKHKKNENKLSWKETKDKR